MAAVSATQNIVIFTKHHTGKVQDYSLYYAYILLSLSVVINSQSNKELVLV